jgi:hypothetical protein
VYEKSYTPPKRPRDFTREDEDKTAIRTDGFCSRPFEEIGMVLR